MNEKFCQKCRVWQVRDNFKSDVTKDKFQKDRLCIPCRTNKEAEALQRELRAPYRPFERRARELAMIKNPFLKTYRENDTYPNLLPGDIF